jgi:hypothetical protein
MKRIVYFVIILITSFGIIAAVVAPFLVGEDVLWVLLQVLLVFLWGLLAICVALLIYLCWELAKALAE